jgi:hypothetical protein
MSGKTKKVLDEIVKYLKENPKQKVYTNSELLTDEIKKIVPNVDVETLKTLPDKSYPNVFVKTDEAERPVDFSLSCECSVYANDNDCKYKKEIFKAGIKEVVDWIENNSSSLYHINQPRTLKHLSRFEVKGKFWQAKLIEWGVEK